MLWWEVIVIGAAAVAWMVILNQPVRTLWERLRSRKPPER